MIRAIEDTASMILEQNPGSVVRHRLLRDVLLRPPDDPELRQARYALGDNRNVQDLTTEQLPDGSWGAFHSRSTRLKRRIPSTEVGVERALSLGLDSAQPVLRHAATYILDILQERRAFPDYHEKNDRWPTGMRLFLASTLSLIFPDHPLLHRDRVLWHEIARRAFRTGKYREQDEQEAHDELTGATVQGSYLLLNGRYQLNVLGSIPRTISAELEHALLGWLWQRPEGIGYLEVPLRPPPPRSPGPLDRWLSSWELLARLFPTWVHWAEPVVEWLWQQCDKQGFWNLGPHSGSYLPLSDDWRREQVRRFDWTTRILALLRRYYR